MATIRQKLALHKAIKNGGNISKAMVEVGYSENTAHTPQKLTGSKGFLELCEDIGLTDDFLAKALFDDIKAKKQNRKPELELAFRVKGRLADPNEIPKGNTYNIFIAEQRDRIARRVLARSTGSEGTPGGLLDSDKSEV